jgi:uncharacterized repeat protein (TIGR03803 family)
LVFDSQGGLYGTTISGGSSGAGTVFKLTANSDGGWTESILYAFSGGTNGWEPSAPLVLDEAGNLYSTTLYGGDQNCGLNGCGAIFELAIQANGSWKEITLYAFQIPAFNNLRPASS